MQGRVFIHPAAARQRFRDLAAAPEAELDLVEASLLIAAEERPRVDVGRHLREVATWGEAVRARVRGSADALRIIDALNRVLFEEEGFHGEDDDYYDPRSALVSEMLERHAGLPITLSVLYIELSRRAGIAAAGLSLPGRFLVKFSGVFGAIVVDPFDGGRVLSAVELQQLLDSVYGGGVRLREHHLRAVSKREILARELSQLKAAYLARRDLPRAAASVDRLLILDDRDPWELRDRAALAMQMHAYGLAVECLERYLTLTPHGEDGRTVREQVDYLRAWLDQN